MVEYFLGLTFVLSMLVLWFFSPLKTTLSELFLGRTLMPQEFDDVLYMKNKWLGELLSCWICCSFWGSLIIGTIITIVLGKPWTYPIITFFSYPGLCYLFYSFVKQPR